jgi:hypothetical protein
MQLTCWIRECLIFLILAASVNQNEAQEILDKAQQYLPVTPRVVSDLQVVIESENEAQIKKEFGQVQEVARDNLIDVCNTFTDSLLKLSSQKKLKCLIL